MAMGGGMWATRAVATLVVALDGTGDFTTIQEAIDVLPATGGVVYVKEGTYSTAVAIDINKDNVGLFGAGRATIVRRSTAGNIIEANNRIGTLIAELYIDGNDSAIDGIYFFGGGAQNKVSRCWIERCMRYGIHLNGVSHVVIDSNFFLNNRTYEVAVEDSVSILISVNLVTVDAGGAGGVYLNNVYNVVISSNKFSVEGFAVDCIRGGAGIYPGGVSVVSNTIFGGGLKFRNSYLVSICANEISTPDEVAIEFEHDTYDFAIVGNTILSLGTEGIKLTGPSCGYGVINSNTLYGYDIGLTGIKFVNARYCTISGNFIEYFTEYGINLDASSTQNSVVGNILRHNTLGNFMNLGIANEADLFNCLITIIATNGSGVNLVEGDVVIFSTTNDRSVITTVTAGYERGVGVIKTGGNNLETVTVIIAGYIPKMLTTSGVGTGRGNFFKTSTTAKKAVSSGTAGGTGDFAVAISNADASGYVSAIFKNTEVY